MRGRQCNDVAASHAQSSDNESKAVSNLMPMAKLGTGMQRMLSFLVRSSWVTLPPFSSNADAIAIMFILAPVNCNNHKVSERQREELHKREEMVGWKGGRDAERVGAIVLCSRYRI